MVRKWNTEANFQTHNSFLQSRHSKKQTTANWNEFNFSVDYIKTFSFAIKCKWIIKVTLKAYKKNIKRDECLSTPAIAVAIHKKNTIQTIQQSFVKWSNQQRRQRNRSKYTKKKYNDKKLFLIGLLYGI